VCASDRGGHKTACCTRTPRSGRAGPRRRTPHVGEVAAGLGFGPSSSGPFRQPGPGARWSWRGNPGDRRHSRVAGGPAMWDEWTARSGGNPREFHIAPFHETRGDATKVGKPTIPVSSRPIAASPSNRYDRPSGVNLGGPEHWAKVLVEDHGCQYRRTNDDTGHLRGTLQFDRLESRPKLGFRLPPVHAGGARGGRGHDAGSVRGNVGSTSRQRTLTRSIPL
jgi:hypothetical protein